MRSRYWDVWKGLCIIAVITLHTMGFYLRFSIGSLHWYEEVASWQLISFPVAIFLAIAGFFSLGSSSGRRIEDAGSYYRRRFKRILIPYLVWTVIYLLLNYHLHALTVQEVSKDVLLGSGISIGYYVIVLVQFVLLTPLLSRIEDKKLHLSLMAIFFLCGLIFTYVLKIDFSQDRIAQFPYYCLPFIVWYPFYHLGLYAAKFDIMRGASFQRLSTWLVPLTLFFAASSIVEAVYLEERGYDLGMSQIKASSLLMALTLFLFSLANRSKASDFLFENKYLSFLGKESYLIYLAHLLLLSRVAHLFLANKFHSLNKLLGVVLTVVVTLALCAILAAMIRKLLPAHHKLLGA